jgi:hypothetical protein
MPRIIQPSGGGEKMRVRFTACRKRGLVAASKRNCVPPRQNGMLPLPAEKLIQNPLEK